MEEKSDIQDIEISKTETFKDAVMLQVVKVTNLCNVEFRGGYYTSVPTKDGEEKEIYVQDSREVFSNGCYALALLLKPKFDAKMTAAFKQFWEDLEIIKKEFLDKVSTKGDIILGESFYTTMKDKILLETYKEKKLMLYLNLFAEISSLLARKNYLQIGAATF